ncbi:hypothetical protein [Penaeicola halotolerans]|uniref:hypothetical protein n=1 Tax=Penaeicola halotolerans TaxID=2793196 RepID=UPI001CF8C970|nr:hypothetical protein [Penaeicola halotolerans]
MIKSIMTLILAIASMQLSAQQLDGAWKLVAENGQTVSDEEHIKIIQEGYYAVAARKLPAGEFIHTFGGPLEVKENSYLEQYDFHTASPDKVGTMQVYQSSMNGNRMTITSQGKSQTWEKLAENADDLTGLWVFTGRAGGEGGEVRRSTPGARRTVKILSGGRFQWIAFNSETKQFSGSGGGTYSANDGNYTENILFFSRDDKRVGASLGFNYEVKDGEWHHSGNSSTGSPIYEIWSNYWKAYKPNK